MLNKIQIEKFRGISHIEIDDFKKINLFVGRNNASKTSVLEAIFLIMGISNPQLPMILNNFRDSISYMNPNIDDVINSIFYNLNSNTPINIHAELQNHSRDLSIKPSFDNLTPSYSHSEKQNSPFYNKNEYKTLISDSNVNSQKIRSLEYKFFIEEPPNPKQEYVSKIVSRNLGFEFQIPPNYEEKINGKFVKTSDVYDDKIAQSLENLIISKKNKQIIQILKEIDGNIKDIFLGSKGMIYCDVGLERFVPISIMGDGIRRLIKIIISISDTKDGIVLIDEIENGLHYTSLKTLWKAIIRLANQYNVQIFVTTHNLETLKYLKEVLETNEMTNFQKDVRSYTLRKLKDATLKAYKYDFEQFGYCVEQGIEIR